MRDRRARRGDAPRSTPAARSAKAARSRRRHRTPRTQGHAEASRAPPRGARGTPLPSTASRSSLPQPVPCRECSESIGHPITDPPLSDAGIFSLPPVAEPSPDLNGADPVDSRRRRSYRDRYEQDRARGWRSSRTGSRGAGRPAQRGSRRRCSRQWPSRRPRQAMTQTEFASGYPGETVTVAVRNDETGPAAAPWVITAPPGTRIQSAAAPPPAVPPGPPTRPSAAQPVPPQTPPDAASLPRVSGTGARPRACAPFPNPCRRGPHRRTPPRSRSSQ